MMAKVFLKEDRYGEKLLKTLNVLRKERKYSDFYIETNSGLVPVHRVVLAAAESCHLKSIGFLCGDINTFDLTEFNKNIVETLVTYLYTGEVDLTGDSDIKDFVNLCQKLDFQSLLNRKEFQKGNSNEVSEKHTNEVFENNTVNNKDSKSGPHPIYLATNRDGQMFVKSVSSVHSNDNHINHDNHDNQNTDVSNTPKLSESTESGSLQDFIIKKEPNSDDDNSDNELDSVEEESGSSQSNKSKQKRPNKKTLEGKNKKLKSSTKSVKQYAEQLVSKVVGMGEEGGDVEEDSGDNNDNDDAGDADNQEESQKDFVIKEEQDTDSDFTEDANSDTDNKKNTKQQSDGFKCNQCKKVFNRKSNLSRHKLIHLGKTQTCDCGKIFASPAAMKEHRKRHADPLIFTCRHADCGKVYSRQYSLQQHVRRDHGVHVPNISVFKCEVCNKDFSQKGHLREHMLSHTTDKQWMCQRCGKTMKYSRSLQRHVFRCKALDTEQKKKVEEQYQCPQCDMIFNDRRYFKDHVKCVHGEASFQCSLCGEMFKWRSSLCRHVTRKACSKKAKNDIGDFSNPD
ncbi:zinc finger protein 347-like isoform X1 [Mytilus trossulus]|uniref:zinc finger protein 347-like isoform X1 n=1 Tax=Mytilus trossulus TaxID=6551 RepID=UPI00300456C7